MKEYLTTKFNQAKVSKCKIQYSFIDDPEHKLYIRCFNGMNYWHNWLNNPENFDKVVHQLLIRYEYEDLPL